MADNLSSPIPNASVLATDEISGVHYPRTKVSFGADGSATDVSSAAPLPVSAAGLATIGTRAYGTAVARLAVSASSAQSVAITASEVLVHASTRMYIAAGASPTATTSDIPLEAGEKFHMRITSGYKVAALKDSADGFLNIIPVA